MKDAPRGWPRLSSSLFYDDANAAIAWLCRAFGFEARLIVEGERGSVAHSELTFGEAVVMVGQAGGRPWSRSPRSLDGAGTQALLVYVDDVDAHCSRARAAGASIATEPATVDYGPEYWCDRIYEAIDPEGHHWWFSQRMSDGTVERRGGVRVRETG